MPFSVLHGTCALREAWKGKQKEVAETVAAQSRSTEPELLPDFSVITGAKHPLFTTGKQ